MSIAERVAREWRSRRLLACAKDGLLAEAERLLEEGVSIEQCERTDGVTALQLAARAGCAEMVRLLLRHGADVTVTDHCGNDAMHEAACNGSVDTLRALIEAGAAPGRANPLGHAGIPLALERMSPLTVVLSGLPAEKICGLSEAQEAGLSEDAARRILSARYLLVHGADPSEALLHFCDMQGDYLEQIRFLLEVGADPEHESTEGWRGAFLAATTGKSELLSLLLGHPKTTTDTLNMSLAFALCSGRSDLAEVALCRGADSRIVASRERLPSDPVWELKVGSLRRLVSAELMAGDIEAAMSIDCGEDAPAPASKGFTL